MFFRLFLLLSFISAADTWCQTGITVEALKEEVASFPPYYFFPLSAQVKLDSEAASTVQSLSFKYPKAPTDGSADPYSSIRNTAILGYRVIPTTHDQTQAVLTKLIKTGDVILSFRPEWANQGPYTNIQLGVSHAGVAYYDGTVLKNIDNPMNNEYLGSLSSSHYTKDTSVLHVIRPSFLNQQMRNNLNQWANILAKNAATVYAAIAPVAVVPAGKIAFNSNYDKPIYQETQNVTGGSNLTKVDLNFVETLGLIALKANNKIAADKIKSGLRMYCSEFAWSLLALANCDPTKDQVISEFADKSSKKAIPSCIQVPFIPMNALSKSSKVDAFGNARKIDYIGLSEGPLAIIDQHLKFNRARPRKKDETSESSIWVERKKLIAQIFQVPDEASIRLSPGHRAVADSMNAFFIGTEEVSNPGLDYLFQIPRYTTYPQLAPLVEGYNTAVRANYSPTAFMLNTFLPDVVRPNSGGEKMRHPKRTMDYVATLVFLK